MKDFNMRFIIYLINRFDWVYGFLCKFVAIEINGLFLKKINRITMVLFLLTCSHLSIAPANPLF